MDNQNSHTSMRRLVLNILRRVPAHRWVNFDGDGIVCVCVAAHWWVNKDEHRKFQARSTVKIKTKRKKTDGNIMFSNRHVYHIVSGWDCWATFQPLTTLTVGQKPQKLKKNTKKSCSQIVALTSYFHAPSHAAHFGPHFCSARHSNGGQPPQKLLEMSIFQTVMSTTYLHVPSRAEHFEPHFKPWLAWNWR